MTTSISQKPPTDEPRIVLNATSIEHHAGGTVTGIVYWEVGISRCRTTRGTILCSL